MKKVITILFCIGAFATSFAQYRPHHWDDHYAYNRKDHCNYGNFSPRDRDFQVERINREFDFKIQVIQNNRSLRRHQKKVAIRELERERAREIQIVKAGFHNWRKGHDRDDYHWDDRE